MSRIPIIFEKIKTKRYDSRETIEYLMTIQEKGGNFDKTIRCDRDKLIKFKEHIESILADSNTAEILNISNSEAEKVDAAHASDTICNGCAYKMTSSCVTCLFELQSPLERKLFIELKKSHIRFVPQYGLNWKGEPISITGRSYHNPEHNFKDVLTIVDFFIEKRDVRLCVYTDGHTYHERTEEQAQRDRTIDRTLQALGFQVLRYTGKDVNSSISKIIEDINKWISNY